MKEYKCKTCYKSYAKKGTLSRHMKYECGKLPRFGCGKCPYRAYQKVHVERHLCNKHNLKFRMEEIVQMAWYLCETELVEPSDQELSFGSDEDEDDIGGYTCNVCGMPVKIELLEEQNKVLNPWLTLAKELAKPKKKCRRIRGNFICNECSRSYIRKDSLQRHLTYECGKEPQFQCPFCPQKCKRKAHRIRHIKRQHKDKIGILEENNPDMFVKDEEIN
ncbi:zinc finger protein 521-like [Anoplophora glabripennis]|uniref:zinc finger protein 521-like n=1 Tax=Anoplophora glabripennis TaxID=217634 RepID=UPI000C75DBC7|nr:zinc finger protein 521-like [Anoplophora glabripennis]